MQDILPKAISWISDTGIYYADSVKRADGFAESLTLTLRKSVCGEWVLRARAWLMFPGEFLKVICVTKNDISNERNTTWKG